MSYATPFKRRRLDEVSNTLKKPFVSPMRTTNKPEHGTPLKPIATGQERISYIPSVLAHSALTTQEDRSEDALESSPGLPTSSVADKRSNATAYNKTLPRRVARRDPAEIDLSRTITKLELQAKRIRNDIDVFAQAEKLRNSSTDADLEVLTHKWRRAAQEASEELFGFVKERINRMGGVQVWRESEQRKHERSNGLGEFAREEGNNADDDKDCEFDSQGEELPEEEQEFRKAEKKKVQQEIRDAADVDESYTLEEKGPPKVWQETGNEDDCFTMDMMLRSLNIELAAIGYDRQAQRWIL